MWMFWIGGTCVIALIWMGVKENNNDKSELNKRIAVLEAKVAILLEERNK